MTWVDVVVTILVIMSVLILLGVIISPWFAKWMNHLRKWIYNPPTRYAIVDNERYNRVLDEVRKMPLEERISLIRAMTDDQIKVMIRMGYDGYRIVGIAEDLETLENPPTDKKPDGVDGS